MRQSRQPKSKLRSVVLAFDPAAKNAQKLVVAMEAWKLKVDSLDSELIQNQRFHLGLAFAMVEGGLSVLSDYATISHCYRVRAGVSRFGNNFESFYQLKAKKKPSKS